MDIINNAMMYMLDFFHNLVGNYGLAIVLLTAGIRIVLWPLNTSQARSMRKMQELQPKIKALQERHKDEPQKMQQEMMKFYAENKFNPFAGCLPMLIQLPIFIGLFSVLNSPEFLVNSVHERFLFVNNLYDTLQSHAGKPMDGAFSVQEKDTFVTAKTAYLLLNDGNKVEFNIPDPHKALTISPTPLLPSVPIEIRLNFDGLGLSDPLQRQYYADKVKSIDILVVNNASKEVEKVTLNNVKGTLSSSLPTTKGETSLNVDVLYLILIYGAFTLLYQKALSPAKSASTSNDPQAKVMKLMPLMFVGMMFFIPMPAGVMIYLVVTTGMMVLQNAIVNFTDKKSDTPHSGSRLAKPSDQIIEVKAD